VTAFGVFGWIVFGVIGRNEGAAAVDFFNCAAPATLVDGRCGVIFAPLKGATTGR
jgi:hypothetical protein